MRKQRRQHRIDVSVTVRRDCSGYRVEDFGPSKVAFVDGATRVVEDPTGPHIIGKSGTYKPVTYSLSKAFGLWRKVPSLQTAEQVAKFMSEWGPIGWSNDEGVYDRSFEELEPLIADIRALAKCIECNDRKKFKALLSGRKLLEITEGYDNRLLGHVGTLFEFMILEMCNVMSLASVTRCEYCGRPFAVGSPRLGLRRQDSKYCSDSHRTLALRKRYSKKARR